jgi:hypothetical protein
MLYAGAIPAPSFGATFVFLAPHNPTPTPSNRPAPVRAEQRNSGASYHLGLYLIEDKKNCTFKIHSVWDT